LHPTQGAAGRKKKTANVRINIRTLFGLELVLKRVRYCGVFYRVFEFPLSRNAQKRNKKKSEGGKL
jgi:hypothetical protein